MLGDPRGKRVAGATAGLPQLIVRDIHHFCTQGLDACRDVMQRGQTFEVALFDSLVVLLVHAGKDVGVDEDHHSVCDMRRNQCHVALVVEQLALLFAARLVGKLTPADRIAHCDNTRLNYVYCRQKDKRYARLDHNLLVHSWITLLCHNAFLRDFDETRENVFSGDADVVKTEPAIVSVIKTKLGAEVSDLDSRHGEVVLESSYLDDERLHAVVLAVDSEPGEDDGVRRVQAQSSRPELGRLDVRRVDDKLVCRLVECRCCLETRDVGAVPKLRLRVAADDVEQACRLVVLFHLFRRPQMLY